MAFACCVNVYGKCAHEQRVRRTLTLTLTLTHTITAYLVSGNVVRVRILICATRQKQCRKKFTADYCANKPYTRSFATVKSTARTSCLVDVLYDISRKNILMANQPLLRCWPRKLPNSARQRKIMAITPYKVIQSRRFWYQSKAHMRFPISD